MSDSKLLTYLPFKKLTREAAKSDSNHYKSSHSILTYALALIMLGFSGASFAGLAKPQSVRAATTLTNPCTDTVHTLTPVKRIVVLYLENTSPESFNGSTGTTKNFPQSSQLSTWCTSVTNATGLTHNSTANYVGMMDGNALSDTCTINTLLPGPTHGPGTCEVGYDNLASKMGTTGSAGTYFKEYLEGMTGTCQGTDTAANKYVAHHNGMVYFNNIDCAHNVAYGNNVTDTGAFYTDINTDPTTGPDLMFVSPNTVNDQKKSCLVGGVASFSCADNFVADLTNAVARSPFYNQTALIITTDEGDAAGRPAVTGSANAGVDCASNPTFIAKGYCKVPFIVVSPTSHAGAITPTAQYSLYSLTHSSSVLYKLPVFNNATVTEKNAPLLFGAIAGFGLSKGY